MNYWHLTSLITPDLSACVRQHYVRPLTARSFFLHPCKLLFSHLCDVFLSFTFFFSSVFLIFSNLLVTYFLSLQISDCILKTDFFPIDDDDYATTPRVHIFFSVSVNFFESYALNLYSETRRRTQDDDDDDYRPRSQILWDGTRGKDNSTG